MDTLYCSKKKKALSYKCMLNNSEVYKKKASARINFKNQNFHEKSLPILIPEKIF